MLTLLTGIAIIVLFALRPFVNKKSSRELPPAVASYFSSFYCMVLIIPTIPLFWEDFFIKESFVFLNPWILVPIIKGVSICIQIKFLQTINKESTSSSAFWGVIGLAIGAIVTTLIFGSDISLNKLIIIISIGIIGTLFFTIGEGHTLSATGKKAFCIVVICGATNTFCDVTSIKYLNWYVLLAVTSASMFLCSFWDNHKSIKIKELVKTKHLFIAGMTFAVGDFVLIFSMQSFFPVLAALFLIRVAQSIDIVAAHHIYKEGKPGLQYFFGLGTIAIAYFFYFG